MHVSSRVPRPGAPKSIKFAGQDARAGVQHVVSNRPPATVTTLRKKRLFHSLGRFPGGKSVAVYHRDKLRKDNSKPFSRELRRLLKEVRKKLVRRYKAGRVKSSVKKPDAMALRNKNNRDKQKATRKVASATTGLQTPLLTVPRPAGFASATSNRPHTVTVPYSPTPSVSRPPRPSKASYRSIPPTAFRHPREESIFVADCKVAIYRDPPNVALDDTRHSIVLYDTGCEQDLVSTDYIKTFRLPESEYATSRRTIAYSITGEPLDSVGTVNIRWLDPGCTRFRYLEATCSVVKSDLFDVIIGRKTLERQKLYMRKPALAGVLFTPPPAVDPETVREVQRLADAKRKQEEEDQKKLEEQKGPRN